MGNLIIKPNTGGLLKLQDEGGTDAISISTTGNTTLAGTANALGTVTTGNLSNTAIVYPAGHVIQTTFNKYDAGNSDALTSATTTRVVSGSSLHWTGQITNVLADSHVRINMGFNWNIETAGGARTDIGGGFVIYRETTMITSDVLNYYIIFGASASVNFYHASTIDFVDESPATGTNNYYLGYKSGSVYTVTVRVPFTCTLQEIAQ